MVKILRLTCGRHNKNQNQQEAQTIYAVQDMGPMRARHTVYASVAIVRVFVRLMARKHKLDVSCLRTEIMEKKESKSTSLTPVSIKLLISLP